MTDVNASDDEALLAEAVLALEQRGEAGLQELLAAHPTQAETLRQGLERLRRMGVLAPPSAAFEAQQFGEFRVLRRLGAGGMGIVYLAEQASLQRKVALKVVRPELSLSTTARERFRREIEAVARLQHPGIVPILAVGEQHGQPWFAMEHLAGRTLEQVIGAVPAGELARATGASLRECIGGTGSGVSGMFAGSWWEAAVRLLLQVAQALVHVHERGIVHRDVKPSNIMVLAHGQPVLLDFGLAHVPDLARVTRDQAAVGSPAYMAPEQVRGEAVDERVDVYGLAVTAYQLLGGGLPFTQTDGERLRSAILAGDARPLRALNRALPRDLEIVVAVAMDRDRARRYGSMAAFAADLENVLLRRPIRARAIGRWLRGVRFAQRHPVFAVSLLAAALLALQFPLVLWRMQAEVVTALERANADLARTVADRDRANTELTTANATAIGERQRAQRAFDEALVAMREMLVRTGQDDLVAVPGSEALRLQILLRADQLFTRLAELRPGDAQLALDAARTLQYIGSLHQALGRRERAEASFRSALDRVAGLPGAEADHVAGVSGKQLGQVLMVRDPGAAIVLFEGARCALERAALARPFDAEIARQHAEVLNSLGLTRRDRGDADAAFELLGAAHEEKRQLLSAAPLALRVVMSWAASCANLAPMLQARGRAADAEALLDDAIDRLVAVRPDSTEARTYRERLAHLIDRRGGLRLDRRDLAGAAADYGAAFALRRELLADAPAVGSAHNQVGASLHNLALWALAVGDHASALDFDTESCRSQRDALARAPGTRSYALHLEYALGGRCTALLELRRLDDLPTALGELLDGSVTPEGALSAARVAIRCGALLFAREGDAAAARIDALHGRAVAAIGVALDRGFRDDAHFTSGRLARHYDPLRGRPDFQAMMARLRNGR